MDLETFKATVPLLAVLLTAALSGYVVPRITRRWQDHQKEPEIKISLVEVVSDEVLQFVLAMQFAERNASTQEAFDEAYRRWEVQRAVLTGKLIIGYTLETNRSPRNLSRFQMPSPIFMPSQGFLILNIAPIKSTN